MNDKKIINRFLNLTNVFSFCNKYRVHLVVMDPNNFVGSAITAGIVSIIYALYKVLKHSNCTSDCCGRVTTVKVDLSPGSGSRSEDLKTPRPEIKIEK